MSDISKCEGKDCALKEKCWRYLAPSSHWQSYIIGKYEDGKCEMFWDVSGSETKGEENG